MSFLKFLRESIKIHLSPELSYTNKDCLKNASRSLGQRKGRAPSLPLPLLQARSVSQSTNFWVLPWRRPRTVHLQRQVRKPQCSNFGFHTEKDRPKKCWAPKDMLCKNVEKEDKPFKRVTLGVPFPIELNVTTLRTCTFWFPDFAESKASITN